MYKISPVSTPLHGEARPSEWIVRWTQLLLPHAEVLDVACGAGRHLRWLAQQGHRVTGVDRDADALAQVAATWPEHSPPAHCVHADLENASWPLATQAFDAVVVTNYLWRPLWPQLLAALRPGGVLLYETFALGQETVGRPARAEFLLAPGELLQTCQALHVVAYENGFCHTPDRFVQRIAAVKPGLTARSPMASPAPPRPPRYTLDKHP